MKSSICNKLRKLLWRNSAKLSPAKQTDEFTYLTVSLSSLVSYLRVFCECPVSAQHSLGNLISYFVIFCTSKTQDDYIKHVNSKISSCLGVLSSFLFSLVSIHSVWVTSPSPLTLTAISVRMIPRPETQTQIPLERQTHKSHFLLKISTWISCQELQT